MYAGALDIIYVTDGVVSVEPTHETYARLLGTRRLLCTMHRNPRMSININNEALTCLLEGEHEDNLNLQVLVSVQQFRGSAARLHLGCLGSIPKVPV